ncbi:hypothetical protein ACFL02_02855 [Planctomycetota bacterium]
MVTLLALLVPQGNMNRKKSTKVHPAKAAFNDGYSNPIIISAVSLLGEYLLIFNIYMV